jgi:squalene-hopene/tetraprenyl-beta-curcumene cyclase
MGYLQAFCISFKHMTVCAGPWPSLHMTDALGTSLPRLQQAFEIARNKLLSERHSDGHWTGELSTSALSTATAVSALSLVNRECSQPQLEDLINRGLDWLSTHQNSDGGWGDTINSVSNLSTTALAVAAIHLTRAMDRYSVALEKANNYLSHFGESRPALAAAVRARYGKDRTFAVPILTTMALAGLMDWHEVGPLPFELACVPQRWYRLLRLHVVSYALPALIAIGQSIHRHRPSRNPITRFLRNRSIGRSLAVLEKIQPSSGGFLEAIPLTSFVTLSLASIGLSDHAVARRAVDFIVRSVRPDGSWAIDSNLSLWVTTQSVNALAGTGVLARLDRLSDLQTWLTQNQFQVHHPYTGAAPGGWGWTDLPGSVPDVDDTAGAMLALAHLPEGALTGRAVSAGLTWLLSLQNRDGGWPTFCKGWGHLPFDRSGPDLTAHAVRAIVIWFERWVGRMDRLTRRWIEQRSLPRALGYLERCQRADGVWVPLWFGNQHDPHEENPTYGTSRVLAAYRDLDMMNATPAEKGIAWLIANQNDDGGWGSGRGTSSSIEETALASEVLIDAGKVAESAVNKGLEWLVQSVISGGLAVPTPIGFYFAKLWYYERLYPIVFSVAALGRAMAHRTRESRVVNAVLG